MKFAKFLLLIPAIALIGMTPPKKKKCKLKYKGIYYAVVEDDYYGYLRFYKDGNALHTTSTEKIEEVKTYFNMTNVDDMLSGTYSFGKCNLTTKVKGKTGKMQMTGTLYNDTLELNVINKNNNTSKDFKFVYSEFDPEILANEKAELKKIKKAEAKKKKK